jgi:unsaturated rhamnogalacturonyl hydrolase
MDAMLRYQDESGMWYQVVNFGGMDKNYLETSGSSIMAYALLKGVRLGFLPESYREYGKKAFDGVCGKHLTTDEKGELHLGGICLVAGLGGKDRRSGTYDYYMSEPVVNDDAKGVGPFLLAYTEMRRL